ncbi:MULTISPECIES: CcdC family protein [Bacillus]|uniref:CcdC family protein n=1 Tax=Bacillus TaxID=1386 RepID=UPI001178AB45|nr:MULTISPECIES: CcdC family protein [Bacillus]MCT6862684.1 CcdC family protein [Bacillus velezensis]MED2911834.1 CcdC family protein [Bacillus velezensis]QOX77230.1 CcdC family protein [Bacillus velezensis]QVV95552.1 CcdC family protein [Bacillus amyloliquefaciens]QYR13662.1 CcdC family protein [Bacillus velezensis]
MIKMMIIISSVIAAAMAISVMIVRIKASDKPASPKKIILPPIFMSTGALMFLFPIFRVTGEEFLEAITLGVIFSIFLIKTSKFEIKNNEIYLKRSKAFVFILIGLLVIRIAMKSILSTTIDYGALSGMFWILAFGMIVPWRIAMFLSYRKLSNELKTADIQMN